jgi:hypothetical protein
MVDTNIRQRGYLNRIENTIQAYTPWLMPGLFPTIPATVVPGGDAISWVVKYDATNNGGLMASYTDAAPDPDTFSTVDARITKDYFQHAAQTFNILETQVEVNPGGAKAPFSYEEAEIDNASKLLATDIATACAADALLQIDSAGNFSDAALVRATYNLASYEGTTVGTLALTDLDAALDALRTSAYGAARTQDLLWMMSNTNWRRVATLMGTAVAQNASAEGGPNIDSEMTHRVASYGSVPIYIDDSLGDADILLLRKGTVGIYNSQDLFLIEKDVMAQQRYWLMGQGTNFLCTNPRWNGKLSGITG